MSTRQLLIGLPPLHRLGREDFLPASANEAALAFVDAWPRWPGTALVIHGPEGAGKSHLAAIWARRADPLVPTIPQLLETPARSLLAMPRCLLLEDIDRTLAEAAAGALAGAPVIEEALFSLWTAVAEMQKQILLTARLPPTRWPVALADLRSRLRGAAAVRVAAPDEELLAALLVKLLADRQLRIGPEVVHFLLPRIERSFAAVHRLAEALDRAALAEHREITIPLARTVLRALEDGADLE